MEYNGGIMKFLPFSMFVFLVGMGLFAQTEELSLWSGLFDSADDVMEQLAYVQGAAAAQDAGLEEFYAKVVARVVREYPSFKSYTELAAADNILRIAVPPLGEAKHTAAAGDLRRAVNFASGGLAKADILIALGKMGDTDFLPQVIQILRSLNTKPYAEPAQRKKNENIAYGAIVSLENFKDPSGYDPVLFASTGWYSGRVKKQALASLPNISGDSTDILISVIKTPAMPGLPMGMQPYEAKRLALETSERSNAPGNKKAIVALAALTEGWKANSNLLDRKRELASLRNLALDMLIRYGSNGSRGAISELQYSNEGVVTNVVGVNVEERDTSEELCAALVKSYEQGSMDEKKRAIEVLRTLKSNDAARLLSVFLNRIHSARQTNTITSAGSEMVKVIIPALGDTGNRMALPMLKAVKYSNCWTGQIRRLADSAIKKIEAASA